MRKTFFNELWRFIDIHIIMNLILLVIAVLATPYLWWKFVRDFWDREKDWL